MTEAGAKSRGAELKRLLPSPEIFIPTHEQLEYSKQHDYGITPKGNFAPSTADAEKLDEEARHPSQKILRDDITFAKAAFTLWQPEIASAYHIVKGAINKDPDEITGGVFGLVASVMVRNLGRPGLAIRSSETLTSKTLLYEGEHVFAVVKDGQILDVTFNTSLNHETYVSRIVSKLPEAALPRGAEVVTFGKYKGELSAIKSATVHGKPMPASITTTEALKKIFR